jgi:membrane protease YdiL (CAAX protease family)
VTIPAYSDAMKVVQVISAVIGFLLPAIVAAFMLSRKPFQLLGFSPQVKPEQVGVVVLLIVAALLVSFALSYFNREIPMPADWKIRADQLEKDYNSQLAGIINLKSTGDYILALLIMAFLPALCEETLFRGGLQNFLTRSTGRPWVSIIIVSLIFSLVHFSYYGFLPRFFLGAVLGFIYHYSGKLWLSILAHFINNALAITVLYASLKEGKQINEIMNEDKTGGGWWGIFLLPVLITLFAYFKKISASDKEAAV